MFTIHDIKNLFEYFADNYIVCQFHNGDSLFTEILLKKDVYVEDKDEIIKIL